MMRFLPRPCADRLGITKPAVSLLAMAGALMGYCAQSRALSGRALAAAAGMLLVSGGASVLNNVQDRGLDRLVSRTASRPLPCGRVTVAQALWQAAALLSAGMACLALPAFPALAAATALAAIALYNGVYTPLKKKTHAAIIPGALCGMLPPLTGWVAAGGDPLHPHIWHFMVLFVLWQVPHAWLVQLSCGREMRAGSIPSALDVFSTAQLHRLVLIWITAFALLTGCWCLAYLRDPGPAVLPILANAALLPMVFAITLYEVPEDGKYPFLFHYLTATMSCMLALPILDAGRRSIG